LRKRAARRRSGGGKALNISLSMEAMNPATKR